MRGVPVLYMIYIYIPRISLRCFLHKWLVGLYEDRKEDKESFGKNSLTLAQYSPVTHMHVGSSKFSIIGHMFFAAHRDNLWWEIRTGKLWGCAWKLLPWFTLRSGRKIGKSVTQSNSFLHVKLNNMKAVWNSRGTVRIQCPGWLYIQNQYVESHPPYKKEHQEQGLQNHLPIRG